MCTKTFDLWPWAHKTWRSDDRQQHLSTFSLRDLHLDDFINESVYFCPLRLWTAINANLIIQACWIMLIVEPWVMYIYHYHKRSFHEDINDNIITRLRSKNRIFKKETLQKQKKKYSRQTKGLALFTVSPRRNPNVELMHYLKNSCQEYIACVLSQNKAGRWELFGTIWSRVWYLMVNELRNSLICCQNQHSIIW